MDDESAAALCGGVGSDPGRIDASDHVDEGQLAEVLMLLEDEAPDALLRTCELFRAEFILFCDNLDPAWPS